MNELQPEIESLLARETLCATRPEERLHFARALLAVMGVVVHASDEALLRDAAAPFVRGVRGAAVTPEALAAAATALARLHLPGAGEAPSRAVRAAYSAALAASLMVHDSPRDTWNALEAHLREAFLGGEEALVARGRDRQQAEDDLAWVFLHALAGGRFDPSWRPDHAWLGTRLMTPRDELLAAVSADLARPRPPVSDWPWLLGEGWRLPREPGHRRFVVRGSKGLEARMAPASIEQCRALVGDRLGVAVAEAAATAVRRRLEGGADAWHLVWDIHPRHPALDRKVRERWPDWHLDRLPTELQKRSPRWELGERAASEVRAGHRARWLRRGRCPPWVERVATFARAAGAARSLPASARDAGALDLVLTVHQAGYALLAVAPGHVLLRRWLPFEAPHQEESQPPIPLPEPAFFRHGASPRPPSGGGSPVVSSLRVWLLERGASPAHVDALLRNPPRTEDEARSMRLDEWIIQALIGARLTAPSTPAPPHGGGQGTRR